MGRFLAATIICAACAWPQGAPDQGAADKKALPTIAGDWTGIATLPQKRVRFVLHVAGPADALRATVDSPELGVANENVDSIDRSGPTLSFTIQYLDVKFSGDVNTNGTIVGTFVQGGTGVPLVLTRTVDAPVPPRILTRPPLPVSGGVFHHDRSGIGFTLPDGWSVRGMETVTNDPGEMAVLADAANKATWASVWMFRTETHPADIPDLLDGSLTRKIASRAGKKALLDEFVTGGYKIRPNTWSTYWSMVTRHCAPLANTRMREG